MDEFLKCETFFEKSLRGINNFLSLHGFDPRKVLGNLQVQLKCLGFKDLDRSAPVPGTRKERKDNSGKDAKLANDAWRHLTSERLRYQPNLKGA